MALTWSAALAWRLRRHLLAPVGDGSVEEVMDRIGAVPAASGAAAELMVGLRRRGARPGDVGRTVADGRLIRTFAYRGATYLMTPERAAVDLTLRAAARTWERPAWRRHYALEPSDWPALRAAVREALTAEPLTPEELEAAITAQPRFAHLRDTFTDRSATLLKPFAWHGDLCLGPPRDGRMTLQRLDQNPRWAGLLDLDDAGPRAVEAYFHAYGPATDDHVQYWLGSALGAGRRRVAAWLAALGDRRATVTIDGQRAHVLAEDVDDLLGCAPSAEVRLLAGHDPWVVAAGTDDEHVVPPARRALVTRGANVVLAGGVVRGTWSPAGDEVVVSWFGEAGPEPDRAVLAGEVSRLAAVLGRPLGL